LANALRAIAAAADDKNSGQQSTKIRLPHIVAIALPPVSR
jgi:hypothetical protein